MSSVNVGVVPLATMMLVVATVLASGADGARLNARATAADDRASVCVTSLQSNFYSEWSGMWGCTLQSSGRNDSDVGTASVGWWNCANALEVVADATLNAPSTPTAATLRAAIAHTHLLTAPLFPFNELSGSNDDKGWWALAWARAGEAMGKEEDYLSRTKGYFKSIAKYQDDVCGGGVWWSSKKGYKNAITNELFLLTAARLYQSTREQAYLTIAVDTARWFNASGLINAQGLVNDGLSSDCRNNGGTTWTYNQGVILAGLSLLGNVTGDAGWVALAVRLADASTSLLVDEHGILREPCERTGSCNNDQTQFKGIFVRYLKQLAHSAQVPASKREQFKTFLRRQADSIWATDRQGDGSNTLFGLHWAGPFVNQTGTQVQTSACDAFNAVQSWPYR